MRLPVAAALLLAACQQQPQNAGGNQSTPVNPPPAPQNQMSGPSLESTNNATGAAAGETEAGETPASVRLGALPPADAPLRFVGRWAAKADSCADKAWRFTATSLNTPAGSQCRFTNVQKVPGGYDIDARCTAEGPETADRITLRFAESARAMLFESKTIAGSGLVWCGE